jgi:hypothetical protein
LERKIRWFSYAELSDVPRLYQRKKAVGLNELQLPLKPIGEKLHILIEIYIFNFFI